MPRPFSLVSSAEISRVDFVEFALDHGAEQDPEDPVPVYDATLWRAEATVWIAWSQDDWYPNVHVPATDEEEERGRLKRLKELELIARKLGGSPKTFVLLDVAKHAEGSGRLALEFVVAFAGRWPCVVESRGKVLSKEELLELYVAGGGLEPYGF